MSELTREQIEKLYFEIANRKWWPANEEMRALCDMALRSLTVESAITAHVLAPSEPTGPMIDAFLKRHHLTSLDAIGTYRAMLAATPVAQEAVAYQGVRMSIAGGINHYTIMPTVGQLVDCGYMESEIRALYAAPVSTVPEDSEKKPLRVWGGDRCGECCNGDRCDDSTHYARKDCPHCKGTGMAIWLPK